MSEIEDAARYSSPVYVAWEYNVHVTELFEIKFLFTQYPMRVLGITLLCSWACGAICLHVLEFAWERHEHRVMKKKVDSLSSAYNAEVEQKKPFWQIH